MVIRSNPIENHILELLISYRSMSVHEIHTSLISQHKFSISKPQLYKVLQKMTNEYILVRKYGTVMLNAYWINQIEKDIQLLQKAVSPIEKTEIIRHGTTQYYTTSSINEQESMRIDITAKILQQEKIEDLYMYDSHLYYMLGFFDTGTRVYEPHMSNLSKMYYLIGNDTFLDTYTKTLAKSKRMNFYTTEHVKFMREGYSIRIIGDYIIEIFIPESLLNTFQDIYLHTHTLEEFNIDDYKGLFKVKTETKFRVAHDKYRAADLKEYIGSFFSKR